MKIRTTLAIFLPVVIIIMAILILILTIYVSKDVVQNQVGNHLLTTAQSRAHNIETLLNDYKKTVQVLSVGIPFTNVLDSNIDYSKRMSECDLRIERTIESNPKISRIKILDNNGIVLSSSHEEIGFDLSKDEIFLKGKENIHFGEVHFSDLTQNLVISISTPIFLRSKLSGVLIISFNIEKDLFIILADKTGLGKTGEIFLINRDGYTLTPSRNYDKIIFEKNVNTEHVKLCFREHIKNGLPSQMKEQATIYTNHISKEVLGTHYYIAEMKWCLIAEIDIEEAYKPVNKLVMLLVYIFLVLLFTSIIIVAIITSNIISPIMKLYAGTEEVIKGNLDYKVGINKKNEIGQLSIAFDKMTKNLKASKVKIERYTGELEDEVKNRTIELNEKIKESEIQRVATVNIANDLEEVNISLQDEIGERKKVEESLRKSEGKYRLLAENTLDCIWKMDEDLKFTYINQSIFPLLGYTREEWTGSKLADHCSKKELQHFKHIVENEIRKKDTYSAMFEMNLIHKDNRKIPLEILGKILLDENNKVAGFQGNARDITERIQAERIQKTFYDISTALNTVDNLHELFVKIREYLGNMIDTTNFYIALYDEETDMITLPFDVDEKDDYETFPAGKTITKYVIKTGKPLLATKVVIRDLIKKELIETVGASSEIWLGVPLKIENKVIGVIAVQSYNDPNLYTENDIEILTFISEEIALAINRKQADERIKRNLNEKDTLLRELYHRTKNNMQIISSMLRMQSRSIENKSLSGNTGIEIVHESFDEVINKIKAMSLVHQKLYQAKDLSHINLKEYITDLIKLLMISFGIRSEKVSLKLDLEDILVLIDFAVPLGLVLNELISNVFKHAFPNNDKDEITIRLYKDNDNTINIHLSDNGVGIPKDIKLENVNTMGLQTVFNLIEYQLKGEITYKFDKGLKWNIKLKDNLHHERV